MTPPFAAYELDIVEQGHRVAFALTFDNYARVLAKWFCHE